VQIVDDEEHRGDRAGLLDGGQQPFHRRADHVDALAGRRLRAQQLGNLEARAAGPASGVDGVQQRHQREHPAQLVARRPEDLAAVRRGVRRGRPQQGCLADARLALDEGGASAARR
jgi:hypothetical protein